MFISASKGNDKYSFINLARAYTYGQGTEIDLDVAKQWCQKAVDLKVSGSQKLMEEIEEKMKKKGKGFSIFKKKK